jgi:hypothetical protein
MDEALRKYLIEGEQAGLRYGLGTPRTVLRGLIGSRVGNRFGSSLEFMDYRDYVMGDDLRRIDWSAFARSDKLSIKLYRDEVSPHVDIVIDCSRSMALADSAKARVTLGLAAVFAQAAANDGHTFAAWQIRDACRRVGNGAERPMVWDDIEFDADVICPEALRRQPPGWRPRGIRVFLSDLFWLGDPQDTLSFLAEQASAVFVVQILAESDATCPAPGNIRLRDCETGRTKDVFVDAVAGKRYLQNLARHQDNWNRGCRRQGATMTTVIAEDVIKRWCLDELVLAEILQVI